MKLSKYLDAYHEYSGKASEVSRQLAFAGIALIWIFKTDSNQLPKELLVPSVFFVLALLFDLMQYVVGALIWKIFHQYHEKSKDTDQDSDIKAPVSLSNTISIFYFVKVTMVLVAFASLLIYALDALFS